MSTMCPRLAARSCSAAGFGRSLNLHREARGDRPRGDRRQIWGAEKADSSMGLDLDDVPD